ncbi:hypothetical protein [Pedobacter nototheniae]|uniref:hypothetical protein n=1 Tax=Pedobacter nototheniae TaxID=2488994 RepID=UPI00103FBF01|nr:hypothetical protein [Pedobacter nototheniae]
MGIKAQFSKAEIRKAIKAKIEEYRDAVTDRLKYSGEEFINLARTSGEYTDRTGNLRNSIGYMLLYNQKIKGEGFVGSGGLSVKEAKKIARRIARDNPDGFLLVGVAGMDYAAAVEAKGKDVITGSSQKVGRLLKASLKRLNRNFNV